MVKLFSFWRLGLRQWCSFNGRTPRSQFYAVFVLLLIAYILPDAWILWGSDMSEYERALHKLVLAINPSADRGEFWFSLFINTWHLLITYMMLALGCRRLHDANHSGWWQFLLIPTLTINGIILYPVLILFLLFVWSRPTVALPNKYGDVPSLDTPISAPTQKSYLFVLIYLIVLFIIPDVFANYNGSKSDKIDSSLFISAAIPAEHTYLLYGPSQSIAKLINASDSFVAELTKNSSPECIFTVIRFIPNKPVFYGLILNKGDVNEFWTAYKLVEFQKMHGYVLKQNMPWYMRLFSKTTSSSFGWGTGGSRALNRNIKANYGVEAAADEMEKFLKEFEESETRK